MSKNISFEPLNPFADINFWQEFSHLKLDKLKLDDKPIQIFGTYTIPVSKSAKASVLAISENCLPGANVSTIGGLIETKVTGTLHNKNTLEQFIETDRKSIADNMVHELEEIMKKGDWMDSPEKLLQFYMLVFVDFKHYLVKYNFCIPTVKLPNAPLNKSGKVVKALPKEVLSAIESELVVAIKASNAEKQGFVPPFMLIEYCATTKHAKYCPSFKVLLGEQKADTTYYVLYVDPTNGYPSILLRNFISAVAANIKEDKRELKFISIRDKIPKECEKIELKDSLYFETTVQSLPRMEYDTWIMKEKGQLQEWCIDLKQVMDRKLIAENAIDLNLKLMKWRLIPDIDLEVVKDCKCLLVGAGSLGCQVARNLLAWGVRHITFIDNGKISYSNPVRQSLFEFEDCGKDKGKAATAAERIKAIFPSAVTSGIAMKIPMPGHPVETKEAIEEAKLASEKLEELVKEHDAIFLLTDTRESRWLPTVLAQIHSKICITAALGFDTFVVLRHGLRHDLHDPIRDGERLGCYFCGDIVAPTNTTKDRTLDQQCTVSRPALCTMASAMAVELLVSLLNAPQKQATGASEVLENCGRSPLGPIPQQIRGDLSTWGVTCLFGQAFANCVGCSKMVVEEFIKRKFDFILPVLNKGDYLEDITGITKMMQQIDEGEVDIIAIDDI